VGDFRAAAILSGYGGIFTVTVAPVMPRSARSTEGGDGTGTLASLIPYTENCDARGT
jgi:hypothetical protein